MKSTIGPWVTGDAFFNRTEELEQLEELVRDGNHVLLTGQRRMGKTSLARMLEERLRQQGWTSLFTDIEAAMSEEEVVAAIAEAVYRSESVRERLVESLGRRLRKMLGKVEEIGAPEFRIKFRAALTQGAWRCRGSDLITLCARHDSPVLLVIDELPVFLTRLIRQDKDRGAHRADVFLSWLREVFQQLEHRSPILLVSGSIGLVPLVQRLRLPDRINFLYDFRLGPWSRADSEECFRRLAAHAGLDPEEGAASAVYDRLGIGVPAHIQCFFARLRQSPEVRRTRRIGTGDVNRIYQTEMLGPVGQKDLLHYDTRLQDALGDGIGHELACRILGEAATQGKLSPAARVALERACAVSLERANEHITMIIEILVHDGYLELHGDAYRFCSRWLRDWWSKRSGSHTVPLENIRAPALDDGRIGF